MTKDEILVLLEKVSTPIIQIEKDLGMPKTTLQKAIKGERTLPKKWALKLQEKFAKKEINDLSEVSEVKHIPDSKRENLDSVSKQVHDSDNRKPFMSEAIRKKLGIK